MEEYLTIKEVGARLRVSEGTVRRWIRAGKLAAVRPGGGKRGRLIVGADELVAFLRGGNRD